MVFLNVLGAKETFFSPKVAIGRMFVSLDEEQSRRRNLRGFDILTCSSNWFVFPAFNTVLRHVF